VRSPTIAASPTRRPGAFVLAAAAGIEDILEIGLQLPPAGELIAIGQLQHRLARPDRVKLPGQARDVGIEPPRRAADAGVTDRQPSLVIHPLERAFVDEPGIGVEIDQVAVAGRSHRPGQHGQLGMLGLVGEQRLIEDGVEAEIALVLQRPPVSTTRRAGRCRSCPNFPDCNGTRRSGRRRRSCETRCRTRRAIASRPPRLRSGRR
jgi:hypothetical protein